ncbi:GN3L_Grn1 domain-containing protein [Zymoseptoria brevis]|uniref:GN3L_Grn1 domain-containing protein n=1 Tax=Zymoseptoria brevis TaxID=1047168 RepID=A0A0F4GPS6_9PEZI|nr:GN3L_Grn1 domain-containing protein [Zymoseptoria brevis]
MVKVGKPKSKRVPVRLRHKIEKSSAAKQRKQRKDDKKNPQWVSRLKKDPGIPNLFPFKDKILAEVEEARRNKEEEKERRKLVAKAQREGRTLADVQKEQAGGQEDVEEDEDEDLIDPTEEDDIDDSAMADVDDSNPMAALLASAEARANTHQTSAETVDEAADEGADSAAAILKTKSRIAKPTKAAPTSTATGTSQRTPLPQKALEDPLPTMTTLLTHLSTTPSKFAPLTSYYALPALPESLALTDFQTRFLVEVARKRGRLGRGGIPNLHAAALTVLADVQEGRVKLPPLGTTAPKVGKKGKGKREVAKQEEGATRILVGEEMAKPFRIEGLFGETYGGGKEAGEKMEE